MPLEFSQGHANFSIEKSFLQEISFSKLQEKFQTSNSLELLLVFQIYLEIPILSLHQFYPY